MKKPLIGIVLGALAMFIWGNISWMVLSWHEWNIKRLPEEQLITDTKRTLRGRLSTVKIIHQFDITKSPLQATLES